MVLIYFNRYSRILQMIFVSGLLFTWYNSTYKMCMCQSYDKIDDLPLIFCYDNRHTYLF